MASFSFSSKTYAKDKLSKCATTVFLFLSPTCLPASLSRMLPTVFTIKLLAKTLRALFPLVHGGGHTTNAVGAVS